jgi:hypothetical protein
VAESARRERRRALLEFREGVIGMLPRINGYRSERFEPGPCIKPSFVALKSDSKSHSYSNSYHAGPGAGVSPDLTRHAR